MKWKDKLIETSRKLLHDWVKLEEKMWKKTLGKTGMEGKMMSSKTMEKQWKKLWLRCETISDGKAMEKSRDYDEEVE